jgi:hypothetical protein
MTKRITRFFAFTLMGLADIPDERNDHLWGRSLGLLLRMSDSEKKLAK